MRRFAIVGTLALVLTAAAQPARYVQLAGAAREFQHHFQELKAGNSLNPIERFVFSLVLSAQRHC